MIQTRLTCGDLAGFIQFLKKERDREAEWDFYLKKYRGPKSFNEWREEVKNSHGG